MSAGGAGERVVRVPRDLSVSRGVVDGRPLIVFAFPSDATSASDREARLALLSPAERDVVGRLLLGRTNARIAEERGTSIRTVSKQVESAYRRLGVSSRCELAALLG